MHEGYLCNYGWAIPPIENLTLYALPIDDLPWVDVFDLCRKDCGFVKPYNKINDYFMMHSLRKDECSCKGEFRCEYAYSHEYLMTAIDALQDYFPPPNVSEFNTLERKQRLKCLYGVTEFKMKQRKILDT